MIRPAARILIPAVLIAAFGFGMQAPAAPSSAVYRGHAFGDPSDEITLRVKAPTNGKARVWFRARNIELECEDGSLERAHLPPVEGRLRGRRFDLRRYVAGEFGQEYFETRGYLYSRSRIATGNLIYVDNRNQGVTPMDPDCRTTSTLGWKAKRRG